LKSPRISGRRGPGGSAAARCERCALHAHLCVCALVTPIDTATRVVVLRHQRETHKPTNTGRLVPLTLTHGIVRTFGTRDVPFDDEGLVDPARRTVLLYPCEGSTEIARDQHDPRPVTLLVPDADWRRAFKFATREPSLGHVPRVHLAGGPPSEYRLRSHMDPRFVATFEAVARALGVLEGEHVREPLELLFRIVVDRHLWSRGRIAAASITGGLPRDADNPGAWRPNRKQFRSSSAGSTDPG
jgi:DTW domain-containing protein YfiP